ncbi:MAG: hypothetical protein KIT16_03325 [Rhodospirillaceae bacterium]|nr:hypothetical protein [Rhodospirillaceae bacterium]
MLPGGPTERTINDKIATAEDLQTVPTRTRAGANADPVNRPTRLDHDAGDVSDLLYRPDPMGRIGFGDWLDRNGRSVDVAKIDRRATVAASSPPIELPYLKTGIATAFNRPNRLPGPGAGPAAPTFRSGLDKDADRDDDEIYIADGGAAFAKEWRRIVGPTDFADADFNLAETDRDDADGGIEPAGWRDWRQFVREALRRGLARTAKIGSRIPPRPPAGSPPLPSAVTGRLDYIRDPHVRNAADRLLDGAVVKGYLPRELGQTAQVSKSGGEVAAFKDFGQFIGRSGGTKHDIVILQDGKVFRYTAPDNSTITFYRARTENSYTNALVIRAPASAAGTGRSRDFILKIRYQ